jgi:hypothetical protein
MKRAIAFVLALVFLLPASAGAADLTEVQRLQRALKQQLQQNLEYTFRVRCPEDAKVRRKGKIVACIARPKDTGEQQLDNLSVVVLILDRRRGYAYDYGTGNPTTRRQIRDEYGEGKFCRDLKEAGAPYFYAVMYWFAEDRPARMDADSDGIPCETVYRERAVDRIWKDRLRF